MKSNKITAIYCRTAAQDSVAIERQREGLLRYAAAHGFENAEVFEDDGFTGNDLARPAFTRMNGLISEGRVTRVLTRNISRLGRGTVAVLTWVRMAWEQGVEIVTEDMGFMLELFAAMQAMSELAKAFSQKNARNAAKPS